MRVLFTDKMKAAWKVVPVKGNSPFNNLAGVTSFESGETAGKITMKIPQESFSDSKDEEKFSVSLEYCDALLPVVVYYDVVAAVVELDREQINVVQSEKEVELKILRSNEMRGKINIPWKVLPQTPDSVYANISGESSIVTVS